jgi:hypothetical protein
MVNVFPKGLPEAETRGHPSPLLSRLGRVHIEPLYPMDADLFQRGVATISPILQYLALAQTTFSTIQNRPEDQVPLQP